MELVLDQFAYSNGNLATVSGGAWTVSSPFGDFEITSGQVKGFGTLIDKAAHRTTWAGDTANQWASVVVSGSIAFNGPTVHGNDTGSFYLFELNINGTQSQITKVVTGSSFTPIEGAFTAHAVAGDVAYLEWLDGILTAKINGTTVGSVSESAFATGRPGMRMYDNTNLVTMDTFRAGDFTSGLPPERVFGLAGDGGGLAGPSRGLAGAPTYRELLRYGRKAA